MGASFSTSDSSGTERFMEGESDSASMPEHQCLDSSGPDSSSHYFADPASVCVEEYVSEVFHRIWIHLTTVTDVAIESSAS